MRALGIVVALIVAGAAEVLQLESIDKLNPNAQVVICTGATCPSVLPGNLLSSGNGK